MNRKILHSCILKTIFKSNYLFLFLTIAILYFLFPVIIFYLIIKDTLGALYLTIYHFFANMILFAYTPTLISSHILNLLEKNPSLDELRITPEYNKIIADELRKFLLFILFIMLLLSYSPTLIYFSNSETGILKKSEPIIISDDYCDCDKIDFSINIGSKILTRNLFLSLGYIAIAWYSISHIIKKLQSHSYRENFTLYRYPGMVPLKYALIITITFPTAIVLFINQLYIFSRTNDPLIELMTFIISAILAVYLILICKRVFKIIINNRDVSKP